MEFVDVFPFLCVGGEANALWCFQETRVADEKADEVGLCS